MSIVYRIDKEKGLTVVLWEGVVTADDFLAHVRRLTSDADWPPPRRLHLSHLRFTSLDASMDEAIIEKAADLYGNHLKKGVNMKVAIVADEAFMKAVAFERVLLRYGASVVVFNFLDNACTWLGIEAEEHRTHPPAIAGPSAWQDESVRAQQCCGHSRDEKTAAQHGLQPRVLSTDSHGCNRREQVRKSH